MSNPQSNIDSGRRPVNVVNVAQLANASGSKSETSRYRFSDQRLIQHFELAIAHSGSIDALLSSVAHIVSDQGDCLGLWACQANAEGEFGSPHLLTQPEGNALWEVVEDHAREMIKRVTRTRQICSSPIRSESNTSLVVAPVSTDVDQSQPVQLVLLGCFAGENQSVLRQQWLVGLVAQTIARWQERRLLKHQELKNRSLNDAIGLIHSLDQTTSVSEASVVVVNHIRRMCQSAEVAISVCDRPGVGRLAAVSDVEQVDLHSESSKITGTACDQAIISGQSLCYPAPEGDPSPGLLALEKFCKANGLEACINLPLNAEDGRTIGSILVATTVEQLNSDGFQEYLDRIVSMTAGHIDIVWRANQTVAALAKRRCRKLWSGRMTKIGLVGLALLFAILCVPFPYRIACDCEIQPVLRRFVAAPYDGILEKTFVESGDLVEQNQLIALLDGRQLRIELSGLRAEFDGARKRRDSALAQGEIATSQIARSEMKRHQSRITILEQQLGHLEVRAPISGIVVNGDLEKVEGAPLEMGQTLFEIAPLDEMLAEIGIPESEIKYAKPGMKVAIKLNAFPFKTWAGTIQQIQPRTEIIDDESVFVAQVKLSNPDNQLRPGMQGSAKITTRPGPIGWNLFHRPWESVRYWMIW